MLTNVTRSTVDHCGKGPVPLFLYSSSRVHIDVVVFAVGSLDQMDSRASFGSCPELFRQDPSVSTKRTFGHASIPKRLEDVVGTGNQFSDCFFGQFGRRQGRHPSLLGTTTTTTMDSCLGGGGSS